MREGALQLPVGGGARVEDVLLGREQRQAVGIEVNGFLVHDATSLTYKNEIKKEKVKKFSRALELLSTAVARFERGLRVSAKGGLRRNWRERENPL